MQHPLFDVFISYAHQDIEWGRWLHQGLSDRGLTVFLDETVLRFGDNVPARIEHSLEHSLCVVLLLSRQSTDSAWVQFESSFNWSTIFIEGKRKLVPALIDKAVEVPARLRSLKFCDLTGRDDVTLRQLADDLLSRSSLDLGPYRIERTAGLPADLVKRLVACLERYLKPPQNRLLLLETALTELVDNALRHTDKGWGSLALRANRDFVEVVVEDGGAGFNLRDALRQSAERLDLDPTLIGGRGLTLLEAQGVLLLNGSHDAGRHWVKATVWWKDPVTEPSPGVSIRARANGSFMVRLSGRLDHSSAGRFEAALARYLHDPGTKGIVFDMRELTYASSIGLRVLMVAARAARQNGFAMHVAGLQPVMVEIFAISRFDRILPVFESVEAAQIALDAKLAR